MRKSSLLSWLVLALLNGCATSPVARPELTALQAEVTAAERAFAKTMADRDFAGFSRFLSGDSVFFDGNTPLRGPEAIAAAWKPLYDGAQPPFSWDPEQVVVLGSGDLALSTGAVRDPQGNVIAQFNSIWRRLGPGQWRVVFDKGCGVCPCAKR